MILRNDLVAPESEYVDNAEIFERFAGRLDDTESSGHRARVGCRLRPLDRYRLRRNEDRLDVHDLTGKASATCLRYAMMARAPLRVPSGLGLPSHSTTGWGSPLTVARPEGPNGTHAVSYARYRAPTTGGGQSPRLAMKCTRLTISASVRGWVAVVMVPSRSEAVLALKPRRRRKR